MGRKVEIDKQTGMLSLSGYKYVGLSSENADVWCPLGHDVENPAICISSCAWFRVVGDNAYCKEHEIGEVTNEAL